MNAKNILAVLLCSIVLISCGPKITVDYDKTVDFTKFKDFHYLGWAKESDKILNDLDKQRIEESFGNEFSRRGVKFVGESEADAAVLLFLVVDQKTSTTAYTTHMGGMGYGYGYPGWGWGGGMSTTSYNDYDYYVGTLVIDIYDVETKKLVWQAVSSGTIDENPQKRAANIPKVAKSMMAQFPIKPVE